MNLVQKKTIGVMAAIIVLMLLFPPMKYANYKNSVGYKFISTVSVYGTNGYASPIEVNIPLLFAQWAGVLIAGGLVVLLVADGKGKKDE